MTFYEAALRILEGEGRPLHVHEITEKSIAQNLLSHVGKTPELTMLSRLAAMAKRTRERRIVCTAKDTFALADLGFPEDAAALALTGVPEENPEETMPSYRPIERHPEPRGENVRAAGRGERDRKRGRRDEEEAGGRRRRFPPIPEVVFEILSELDVPLKPDDLLAKAREKELAGDELSAQQMLTALLEDNQRRIDAGRRPQFVLTRETGEVTLEKAGAPSEAPPLDLQAAFAAALGIPLEGGRPVLPRSAGSAQIPGADLAAASQAIETTVTNAREARKAVARNLRRKLADLDAGTFERAVIKLLHKQGFREVKVAKRSKEGPLVTCRRRDGSVEFRYAVRIIRGSPSIDRRMVQDLKRDLNHYSAHIALLVSPGDVRGDARSEAQSQLVFVWCGDGLAEKFLEAETGVKVERVELFEIDDRFFEAMAVEAEEARKRREERREERERGEGDSDRERGRDRDRPRSPRPERGESRAAEADEGAAAAPHSQAAEADGASAEPAERAPAAREEVDGDDDEGDDEGDDDHLDAAAAFVAGGAAMGGEGVPAGPGQQPQGSGRRRRRRRRGRRGRGGLPGAPGAPAGAPDAASASGAASGGEPSGSSAPAEAPPRAPEPPASPPPGDQGS